jgi:hypothetical protein
MNFSLSTNKEICGKLYQFAVVWWLDKKEEEFSSAQREKASVIRYNQCDKTKKAGPND